MLAEKTYKSLKTMIYSRELEPGERLVERKLSRKLGVSRVPLRESLVRLESEGLVERVPNGPSRVIDFSQADVVEMYSMRLLLEPFATRLAASNHQRSLIQYLRRLCKSMTRHSKAQAWTEMDRVDCEFHHAIVEASGHKMLLQAYENCHIQIGGMLSDFSHLVAGQPPETNTLQHLPIIDAIEKRDPAQAEALAFDHIKVSVDKIQECFGTWLAPQQKMWFEHSASEGPAKSRP